MPLSVDDALQQLGGFGLFQWILLFCGSIGEIGVGYQALLLSFIGAEPPWSCVNGSTICNITGSFSVNDDDYNFRCNIPRSEWYFHDDFTSIVTEFELICGDSILATIPTTLIFIGWLIAGSIFGYVSDKFGRKISFLYCVINITIVPLAGAFSNSIWLFTASRILVGTGLGAASSVFVLITEFSGVKHRGISGLALWFSWIFGLASLSLLAYLIRDWRHLTITTSALLLPCFIAWWLFPESIRWLLLVGQSEKVDETLQRIAKYNKTPMIKEALIKPEVEHTVKLKDLFSTPAMRKVTLLSCLLWGVNAAVYYGVSFSSVTLGGNMYLNFFISSLVELPANIVGVVFLNRIGRKPLVKYGMIFACLMSVGAVVCQIFEEEQSVSDGYWMARVFLSMGAKFAITVSFNCVWIWSNELFPTVVRTLGMGFANSLSRLGSFSSGYIIWLAKVHVLIPYAIFATLTFFAAIACQLLPETANRATQETIVDTARESSAEQVENGIDNGLGGKSIEENEICTSKL